jgi:MFS family permease
LTDAGYFKQVIILGTFLQVFGIMMTSLSTQYWQLFLAQGVCVGLGNGCLFTPMVSLVSTYFSKKRSLAIGVVACGSATGGLIFPAMVQQLLPKVGFGWTIRALGFVQLACLVTCIVFAKQRLPPRRAGPIVEWAAFKELPYVLFAAGMFFVRTIDLPRSPAILTSILDFLGCILCILLRMYRFVESLSKPELMF